MYCYEHEDIETTKTCEECGVGLCNECESKTIFKTNKKALCRRCNLFWANDNARIFKTKYETNKLAIIIYTVSFLTGILVCAIIELFFLSGMNSVIGLFIIWGIGSLICEYITKIKISDNTGENIVNKIINMIFNFFIRALFIPVFLIFLILDNKRLKKEITENNEILKKLNA